MRALIIPLSFLLAGCANGLFTDVTPTDTGFTSSDGGSEDGGASDGGTEDGGSSDGGSSTDECDESYTECDGDTVYWCEDGEIEDYDCTQDGTVDDTCGYIKGEATCVPNETGDEHGVCDLIELEIPSDEGDVDIFQCREYEGFYVLNGFSYDANWWSANNGWSTDERCADVVWDWWLDDSLYLNDEGGPVAHDAWSHFEDPSIDDLVDYTADMDPAKKPGCDLVIPDHVVLDYLSDY